MIDKQLLLQGCKQFEIELSTQAAEQLDTYAQLLVEWNGKMNLTAITEPQAVAELSRQTGGALGQKLRDMQLIFDAFQALVEQRFHDPLDELTLALARAEEKNWFAGRQVWVDSFDYFSVSERAMLQHLSLIHISEPTRRS